MNGFSKTLLAAVSAALLLGHTTAVHADGPQSDAFELRRAPGP